MTLLERIETVAIWIAAAALFVVMVVGAVDIVMGEVFGRYLPFKVDLSGMLLAVAIFLSWPLAQRHRDHIRVDLFLRHASPGMLLLSRGLGLACGLLVFGLIAHGAWHLAVDSVAIREASAATLGFPIYPAKVAAAVGASLTVLVIAHQIISALLRRLRTRDGGASR